MEKKIGIYKIINPKGKIYIGQSTNIYSRLDDYKKIVASVKSQIKIYNSLKKYGSKSHLFEIIEECSVESLNERERYWQDYYNVLNEGLNCKLTKTGDKSGFISQEIKNKIGNSNRGKVRSGQALENIRKSRSEKFSYKWKVPKSEEFKNKVRGVKKTQEHIQKIKDNRPNKKSILQYDLDGNFIREWESCKSASNYLGKNSPSVISSCCNKKIKYAYGYQWRFKGENIIFTIDDIYKKKILQHSINGEFIKEWNCLSDIVKFFNIKYPDCIKANINKKVKHSKGFVWSYK